MFERVKKTLELKLGFTSLAKKDIKTVDITRYTLSAFRKCYPFADVSEYEVSMSPDDTLAFVLNSAQLVDANLPSWHTELPNIRVVPLDEEYICWLSDNNKEHDMRTCAEYVNLLGEENINRLFAKNEWNVDYVLLGLPILIPEADLSENTEYKFSDDIKMELNSYLESIYGKGNVFVSNYILEMNDYYKNPSPFLNMAKAYFEDGTTVKLNRWDIQEYNTCNNKGAILIIPFAVKFCYESAEFNMEEIVNFPEKYATAMCYSKKRFKKLKKEGTTPFTESLACKMVGSYFTETEKFCIVAMNSIMQKNIPEEIEKLSKIIQDKTYTEHLRH